jgi:hypothetical protein
VSGILRGYTTALKKNSTLSHAKFNAHATLHLFSYAALLVYGAVIACFFFYCSTYSALEQARSGKGGCSAKNSRLPEKGLALFTPNEHFVQCDVTQT